MCHKQHFTSSAYHNTTSRTISTPLFQECTSSYPNNEPHIITQILEIYMHIDNNMPSHSFHVADLISVATTRRTDNRSHATRKKGKKATQQTESQPTPSSPSLQPLASSFTPLQPPHNPLKPSAPTFTPQKPSKPILKPTASPFNPSQPPKQDPNLGTRSLKPTTSPFTPQPTKHFSTSSSLRPHAPLEKPASIDDRA